MKREEMIERFDIIIRELSFHIKHEGRTALRSQQLTTSLFEILQMLYFSHDRSMKGKELAEMLEISHPAVSEKLKALEQKLYIAKEQGRKDKREVVYTLSEKGAKIVDNVIKRRLEYVTYLCDGLPLENVLPILQVISEKNRMHGRPSYSNDD